MTETNEAEGQRRPDEEGGEPPGYGEPSGQGEGPALGQATPLGQRGTYGPQAPPGYADTAVVIAGETSPIHVSFADPVQQRRVSIALRLLLAIPHFVVLWALGIAAGVIAVIGWFAALFTGRLPDGAHPFLTQVLRWQTRVCAYLLMLTDRYPPFSLDDDDYPVRLVSRRTDLNRLAVLFRLILVIPAVIVLALATYGLAVLAFFTWLITLVTAELPTALHQAIAAVVRYQARFAGYLYMVTSEYPWHGLYGDALPVNTDFAASVTARPELDPRTDRAWRLQLSRAAKSLLTAMLVLGAIAFGVQFIANTRSTAHSVNNARALRHVEAANSVLTKNSEAFTSAIQTCDGQLSCVTSLLRMQAQYLQAFNGQINGVSLNGQAASDAARLVSADNVTVQALNQLARATNNAQYMHIVRTNSLQQDLKIAEADYAQLVRDLGGVTT